MILRSPKRILLHIDFIISFQVCESFFPKHWRDVCPLGHWQSSYQLHLHNQTDAASLRFFQFFSGVLCYAEKKGISHRIECCLTIHCFAWCCLSNTSLIDPEQFLLCEFDQIYVWLGNVQVEKKDKLQSYFSV